MGGAYVWRCSPSKSSRCGSRRTKTPNGCETAAVSGEARPAAVTRTAPWHLRAILEAEPAALPERALRYAHDLERAALLRAAVRRRASVTRDLWGVEGGRSACTHLCSRYSRSTAVGKRGRARCKQSSRVSNINR